MSKPFDAHDDPVEKLEAIRRTLLARAGSVMRTEQSSSRTMRNAAQGIEDALSALKADA